MKLKYYGSCLELFLERFLILLYFHGKMLKLLCSDIIRIGSWELILLPNYCGLVRTNIKIAFKGSVVLNQLSIPWTIISDLRY